MILDLQGSCKAQLKLRNKNTIISSNSFFMVVSRGVSRWRVLMLYHTQLRHHWRWHQTNQGTKWLYLLMRGELRVSNRNSSFYWHFSRKIGLNEVWDSGRVCKSMEIACACENMTLEIPWKFFPRREKFRARKKKKSKDKKEAQLQATHAAGSQWISSLRIIPVNKEKKEKKKAAMKDMEDENPETPNQLLFYHVFKPAWQLSCRATLWWSGYLCFQCTIKKSDATRKTALLCFSPAVWVAQVVTKFETRSFDT